jgi:hypothetical protein
MITAATKSGAASAEIRNAAEASVSTDAVTDASAAVVPSLEPSWVVLPLSVVSVGAVVAAGAVVVAGEDTPVTVAPAG